MKICTNTHTTLHFYCSRRIPSIYSHNENYSVDSSGSNTTSPIRAPSEIQAFRNVVLKDIIDSEKAHVAEMQGLITNFLQPLDKSEMWVLFVCRFIIHNVHNYNLKNI